MKIAAKGTTINDRRRQPFHTISGGVGEVMASARLPAEPAVALRLAGAIRHARRRDGRVAPFSGLSRRTLHDVWRPAAPVINRDAKRLLLAPLWVELV